MLIRLVLIHDDGLWTHVWLCQFAASASVVKCVNHMNKINL
jgi:hypothetical protein